MQTAVAPAGNLAVLVRLVEIGLEPGKLGFVPDSLSKEVQVDYTNGLAIPITVGHLPKLFGLSIDANGCLNAHPEKTRTRDPQGFQLITTGPIVVNDL